MRRRLAGCCRAARALGCVLVFLALASCQSVRTAEPEPPLPNPATSADYVGAETCKGCHEEAFTKFSGTRMGRLFLHEPRNDLEHAACESCHGPGKAHVEAGGGKGVGGMITFAKNDPTPVSTRNAVCVQCHKRGPHLFWKGSPHESRDVACTNCHQVMQPVPWPAQLAQASEIETCGVCHQVQKSLQLRITRHPLLEGKMRCTSCHNPHGSATPPLLKGDSLNDTCYTCHAEKRGPFLWEHPPVLENCGNCHNPHGSNHQAMLKVAKPRLCQQCHIETRHPTSPYGTDTPSLKFVLGRACNSCHINIHGSNHPAGFAFTR